MCLTVTQESLGVASLPRSSVGTADGIVGAVSLDSEATRLSTSRGEASTFTVFVDRIANPVDSRVVFDSNVSRVDENDFVVSVGGILVYPVRVQDAEVSTHAASTLLSNTAKVAYKFDLVNTLVLRLAIDSSFGVRALSATSADSHTVHDVSLLSLNNSVTKVGHCDEPE